MKANAVQLVAYYYGSSFLGHAVFQPAPGLDKWASVLWDFRREYGKAFMDKAMFLAIKRWQPYGFDKQDVDFDSYFGLRFEAGAAVLDNNGQPLGHIRDMLKRRGLIKPS